MAPKGRKSAKKHTAERRKPFNKGPLAALIVVVVVIAIILLTLPGSNPGIKEPTTSARLTFTQHQYNLSVGDEAWISFRGERFNNTVRVESVLEYDTGLLAHKGVRDVSQGNMVVDAVSTPNRMEINQYREPGIYGNGELFRILFKAEKAGVTKLKFEEVWINGVLSETKDEAEINIR